MDNGSDYEIFKHDIENNPERSTFNLSYLHTFTQEMGELRPFYLEETVPGDKFTISNDILCRVQALEVPVMSNIRIYTHYYYSRMNELWANWNNFCTRGRSGNYDLAIGQTERFINVSTQNKTIKDAKTGKYYGMFTQDSLANALGIPILQKYGETGLEKPSTTKNVKPIGDYSISISSLPFFMYQRIYRDYYLNANLNQSDKHWFPDDEYGFIMAEHPNEGQYRSRPYVLPTTTLAEWPDLVKFTETGEEYDSTYCLMTKRYRNWRDDYFTSAMPWPQRGETPFIEATGEDIEVPELTIKGWTTTNDGTSHFKDQDLWVDYNERSSSAATDVGSMYLRDEQYHQALFGEKIHTPAVTLDTPMAVKLTMESLRKLTTMQLWQERNARVRNTGNFYNNMIKSHFGFDPKDKDNTPTFIGGTVQDISISEVLQTSQTDTTTGNALGQSAGHGISASSGYVGEFTAPDYGYIMGIMSIVPDVTYSEGLDRMWTRETFADIYYPEFNGLGPQAILNKEVKIQGNQEENDTLWAYQERNAEYKHRRNRISGDIANKFDKYYSAWTMARFFETRPNFNQEFITTENNISKRSFTFEEEAPFVIQVANIVKATRPMPYLSTPKGLI